MIDRKPDRWIPRSTTATVVAATLAVLLVAVPDSFAGQSAPSGGQQAEASPEASSASWQGHLRLGYNSTRGNADSTGLNVSGDLTGSATGWGFVSTGKIVRATADGRTVAESYEFLVAPSKVLNDSFDLVALQRAYVNEFAGLRVRNSLLGGPRWWAHRTDRWQLNAAAGLGWEHEDYSGMTESVDLFATALALNSTLKASDTSTFVAMLAAILDNGNASNYRMEMDLKLQAMIYSWFGLQLEWDLKFDNEPVDAPDQWDSIVSAGVTFSFGERN